MIGQVRSFRGIILGSFGLDGSFAGPIWRNLFGVIWWDPLVGSFWVACYLSVVVGSLTDLDYLGELKG